MADFEGKSSPRSQKSKNGAILDLEITCSGAENQPGYVMSFVNTHEIDTKGTPEHILMPLTHSDIQVST